jgi:hypothetical protein
MQVIKYSLQMYNIGVSYESYQIIARSQSKLNATKLNGGAQKWKVQ